MNTEELNRNINALRDESKKLEAIYNNGSKVFDFINNLDKDRIDELLKLYGSPKKLTNQFTKEASAANIVRYVTLRQLAAGQKIEASSVEKIKQSFLNKNSAFFKPYLDESIIKKINEYAKKDPFGKLWDKTFSLLHPFIIGPSNFRLMLKQLASSLNNDLGLKDIKAQEFDFTGARNEGAAFAWLVIYPRKLENHQKAYRLSVVFKDGAMIAYLDVGWEVEEDETRRNIHEEKCADYSGLKDKFAGWKEEYLSLNTPLLKEVNTPKAENIESAEEEAAAPKSDIPLNQILYGPPGTGKTYNTIIKALEIIGGAEIEKLLKSYLADQDVYMDLLKLHNEYKDKGQIKFITFHQNYSYEEFIEGITPDLDKKEELSYILGKGPLKEIAERAAKDQRNKYVLIIDEINRGNISKIFGELITLIEEDKRAGNNYAISLPLIYSKKDFSLPNNLYIIGTMNTADKSIALVDVALRRRFAFIEMMPKADLIEEDIDGVMLQDVFKALNKKISILADRDHQIGHSYFINVQNIAQLRRKWFKEILPLLNEYFYGDWEKLKLVLSGSFITKVEEPSLKETIEESWTFKEETMDNEQFVDEINNIAVKQ